MTKPEGNDAGERAPGAGEDTGPALSMTIDVASGAETDGAGDNGASDTEPVLAAPEPETPAGSGTQTPGATNGESPTDGEAAEADTETVTDDEAPATADEPTVATDADTTTDQQPATADESATDGEEPAANDDEPGSDRSDDEQPAAAADGSTAPDEPTTTDDGGTGDDDRSSAAADEPPGTGDEPTTEPGAAVTPPLPPPAPAADAPATMEIPAITLEPSLSAHAGSEADEAPTRAGPETVGPPARAEDAEADSDEKAPAETTDSADATLPPVPLSALERLAQAFAREDSGTVTDEEAASAETAPAEAAPEGAGAAALSPTTEDADTASESGPVAAAGGTVSLSPGRPAPTAPPPVQVPPSEEVPAFGPPDPVTTEPPPIEEAEEAQEEEEPEKRGPAHAAPRGPTSPLQQVLAPVRALPVGAQVGTAVLAGVLLLLVAWGLDTVVLHGSSVHRNVEIAGTAVGGRSQDDLDETVADLATTVENRPVTLTVDGEPLDVELTPAELGISVDRDAASAAAWDVGRGQALPLRPFEWAGSLVSERTVSLEYEVEELQAIARILEVYETAMEDGQVVAAVEPEVRLEGGEFVAVAGSPGQGLDPDQVVSDLLVVLETSESTPGEPATLLLETTELLPGVTDRDAEGLADELNRITAPLAVKVGDTERELSSEQLRSWVTPTVSTEELGWDLDEEAASAAVAELFADLSEEPTNAHPRLTNGAIEIVPSEDGRRCCTDDTGERLTEAMESGEGELVLDLRAVEPEFTTEAVEDMGIVEPVGGNRGWRAGADVEGPRPGFTTWEVGGGGRAQNIGLIAEEVNGAWIPPGGTWGINDHVGARECPPYAFGGAIVDGEHVDVCGGGISQFGTTMLNAAYFAGLDISGFRAHSEYFSRYPLGREATMGAPGGPLDVVLTNNTPYGIYIQSARHGDELTVTLWSTQHIDVEQTGISESYSGECRYVTTTRTRTYPDGSTEEDTFSGAYGPGGDVRC